MKKDEKLSNSAPSSDPGGLLHVSSRSAPTKILEGIHGDMTQRAA